MIKIIAAAAIYVILGFITLGFATSKGEAMCNLRNPDPGFERGICYQTNAYQSVFVGMFWPIYVTFNSGSWIYEKLK